MASEGRSRHVQQNRNTILVRLGALVRRFCGRFPAVCNRCCVPTLREECVMLIKKQLPAGSVHRCHESILHWLVAMLCAQFAIGCTAKPIDGTNDNEESVLSSTHEFQFGDEAPVLAIWRDSARSTRTPDPPYLRVAIWSDGRVVFARDPSVWSHDLREGHISREAAEALLERVDATGVFDLPSFRYLVPDAPIDCLLVVDGERSQILYWDEVEMRGYGINIDPQPHHLAFMAAWKQVNALAIAAVPQESVTLEARFTRPPDSWYIKRWTQPQ